MFQNRLLIGIALIVSLTLTACSSNDSGDAAGSSTFNPDLPEAENTGAPGGDTTSIAGLWNGTTIVDGVNDVVYWSLAADGVLTRYDYQQDGVVTASGENCYTVGQPITVTPEGGEDYSIFDVAVTAVRSDNALTIRFVEADKNDLDVDDNTTELPIFNWALATTPALEDLNSCALAAQASDEPVADDPVNATAGGQESVGPPVAINWSDIPRYSGDSKPYITRAECSSNGGVIVGDIGDGTVFQPEYRCTSGSAPIAYVTHLEGEPISIEGEVCCV